MGQVVCEYKRTCSPSPKNSSGLHPRPKTGYLHVAVDNDSVRALLWVVDDSDDQCLVFACVCPTDPSESKRLWR